MVKNKYTTEKKTVNKKVQWVKFIIVLALYLAFLLWVKSWLGLIVVPFIFDAYITRKINWQWWKDEVGPIRWIWSWIDALVFALVAVYFINLFVFQNYVIPSSSLEKSLLTGDYLFVSKMSYGPRVPQTPLTMPLTQHTLPIFNCKSYIEWPQWDYKRVKGLGKIQQNDIVVFNYPAGDTIMNDLRYQAFDYYRQAKEFGLALEAQQNAAAVNPSLLNRQQQYDYLHHVIDLGAAYIKANPNEYGDVTWRPVDRRENYVKRCVGLPGQWLQIKNRIVYIDGKPNKEPDNVQYTYRVKLRQSLPEELMHELGISMEDLISLNQTGVMPLTKKALEALKARTDIVESIELNTEAETWDIYPRTMMHNWTRDNYGPIWIPKRGETLQLSLDNIAIYERPIRVYEGNELEVKNGQIYINGQLAKEYTFKMDYYWMMGDNRHNSADSRYWGFVPEDHIVGKPIFIWWSSDPDRKGFAGIRWNRLFRVVDNIK